MVDHNQSLVDGLIAAGNIGFFQMIRRTRRALSANRHGRAYPLHSPTSSQFSPTGQDSGPPKSRHQARIVVPTPGPVSPLDPSRPGLPASFRTARFHHSPKHSLGFISTPLRKRPSAGRRPAAPWPTPGRVEVHVTKPSASKTRPTARPSSRNTTPTLRNQTHTTIQMNSPVSTPKSSSSSLKVTTNMNPMTNPDSETLLGPQASVPSRDSSPRQHKGEASSSPSGPSNRKNKVVASSWLPLSITGGDFQTRNWTDPLEYSSGSEMFVYELTDIYEYDTISSQEELPTSSTSRVSRTLNEDVAGEISLNITKPKSGEHFVVQPTPSLTEPADLSYTVLSLEVSPKLETKNPADSSLSAGHTGSTNSLNSNKDGYIQTTSSAKIRPSPVFHQGFLSLFTASLRPPSIPSSILGPSFSFTPLLQFSAFPWVSVTSHPSVVPLPSPSSNLQRGFYNTAANPFLLAHPVLSGSPTSNSVPKIQPQSDALSHSDGAILAVSLSQNSSDSLNSPVENPRPHSDGSSPSVSPVSLQSDLRDLKDEHPPPDGSHLGHLEPSPTRLQPELVSTSLPSSLSDIFHPALTQSQSDNLRMFSEMSPLSVGNSEHTIGNPALFPSQTSAEPFLQPVSPSSHLPNRRTTAAQLGIPDISNLAHTQPPSYISPPLASSRVTVATVIVTEAEIGFLSPTRPTAAFLNKESRTPHDADTQPFEFFLSLSRKQSSTLSGDEWETIPSQPSLPAIDADSDGVSSPPANDSLIADTSRMDSVFDLADVALKMFPAEERVSDVRVSSPAETPTPNGMLKAASKHNYNPNMMDASRQTTVAVTPTPLPFSDPNPAASSSPTSSSIRAPNQNSLSELKEFSVSGNADTAAEKNSSETNKDVVLTLKDVPSEPAEVTQSTHWSPSGSSAVTELSPASDPSLWNHGALLKPPAAATTSSSDTGPTTLHPALSVDSCHCKRTLEFPCLCEQSSGKSMSEL